MNSVDVRKRFVLDTSRSVAPILFLSALSRAGLVIDAHQLSIFVSKKLGDSGQRYFVELADDFKSTHCLGSRGLWFFLTSAVIEHFSAKHF